MHLLKVDYGCTLTPKQRVSSMPSVVGVESSLAIAHRDAPFLNLKIRLLYCVVKTLVVTISLILISHNTLSSPISEGGQWRSGQIFQSCPNFCPEMIVIPSGDFKMGSPEDEPGRKNNESPLHEEHVKTFALSRNLITIAEFAKFVEEEKFITYAELPKSLPCLFAQYGRILPGDIRPGLFWKAPGWEVNSAQPVVCIAYSDAVAYVEWLGKKTGKNYRIPTEIEWEYAARAGTTSARPWNNEGRDSCEYMNSADLTLGPDGVQPQNSPQCKDGYYYVSPISSYKANAFELFDMLGNASQWTSTCWSAYANSESSRKQLGLKKDQCPFAVVRGCSWISRASDCRSAHRVERAIDLPSNAIGFRIALDPS